MSNERWLPIPGYEGRYEVSDQGRVRTYVYGPPGEPRLRKLWTDRQGYLVLSLHDGTGRSRVRAVHVLVALAFHGSRPEGFETRHLDGDRTHNAATNLAYGTHAENQYDSVQHGTHHFAHLEKCRAGHEFSPENTYHSAGRRHCRACRRVACQRFRIRKRSGAA